MGQLTQTGFELPEGMTILERDPPEPSVELALDLARRGASEELVRAIGGEEAVEAMHSAGNGHGGNGGGGSA